MECYTGMLMPSSNGTLSVKARAAAIAKLRELRNLAGARLNVEFMPGLVVMSGPACAFCVSAGRVYPSDCPAADPARRRLAMLQNFRDGDFSGECPMCHLITPPFLSGDDDPLTPAAREQAMQCIRCFEYGLVAMVPSVMSMRPVLPQFPAEARVTLRCALPEGDDTRSPKLGVCASFPSRTQRKMQVTVDFSHAFRKVHPSQHAFMAMRMEFICVAATFAFQSQGYDSTLDHFVYTSTVDDPLPGWPRALPLSVNNYTIVHMQAAARRALPLLKCIPRRLKNEMFVKPGQFANNTYVLEVEPLNALTDACRYDGCRKALQKKRRCAKCHSVRYCSKECQVKDWPVHKEECKAYVTYVLHGWDLVPL